MYRVRKGNAFALAIVFLVLGSTPAAAVPQLLLHWDRGSGTSQAVVENSFADVLAEYPWDEALPRRYSSEEEEAEIPMFLLGTLRDQLETSVQPEADDALDFIRDLMGSEADTPAEELPESQSAWISYTGNDVAEWCGTVVTITGECTQPGNPESYNLLCTQFTCKRTKIEPTE